MLRRILTMSFYAVRSGRVPGIYRDWDTCKAQVNGFGGARYKKFKSQAEAQAFIDEGSATTGAPAQSRDQENGIHVEEFVNVPKGPPVNEADLIPLGKKAGSRKTKLVDDATVSKKRGNGMNDLPPNKRQKQELKTVESVSATDDISAKKPVDIYTDGACERNGQHNARAAIGVFWGVDSPLNVSERLPGRQTNNRAEIHAARKAIDQAKMMGRTNIRLFTDSQFLINAMTKWVRKWEKNGWKLISGQPVINREDFEQLLFSAKGMKISWIKVAAHSNIFGNEWADKLAVAGLNKPVPEKL